MPTLRTAAGCALLVVAATVSPMLSPAVRATDEPSDGTQIHVVARGENLWRIARTYGVTVSDLVRANNISTPSLIRTGLRLTVPAASDAPPASADAAAPSATTAPAEESASAPRTHVVVRGESLWAISRRYGVTVAQLAGANGIANPALIRTGLLLTIPGTPVGAAPAPAPAPAPATTAPGSMPSWMAARVAQREPMRQLIATEAQAAGVPVSLALAVAWQESGWRQDVVSSAGAVGVMQLMPGTARWVGETMLRRSVQINDATDNVRAGVRLLAHYLDRYDGNLDLVLAAYYQGQGAADRHGVYPVSRPYVASVRSLMGLFGG